MEILLFVKEFKKVFFQKGLAKNIEKYLNLENYVQNRPLKATGQRRNIRQKFDFYGMYGYHKLTGIS